MASHTIRLTITSLRGIQVQSTELKHLWARRKINSDHVFVMVTMKLKLKKNLRNHGPRLKFNLEKLLRDPRIADLFEATIGGIFAALYLLKET